MKIINLKAENIKRLTAVEITPAGNMVEITGKNGNGKTSVLDAIWWCLGGTDAVQAEPIRRGADSAQVTLDLGDYVVTRKFKRVDGKPSTTSLTVANREGARFQSPQSMLDGFLSGLTFDPLEFARMKPQDQFNALRSFVPSVDFAAVDKANKADYDARRIENSRAKDAESAAKAITVPETMQTRVNLDALENELAQAGEWNAAIEREISDRRNTELAISGTLKTADEEEQHAEALEQQAAALRAQAQRRRAGAKKKSEEAAARPPLAARKDAGTITARLREARAINEAADAVDRDHARRDALLKVARDATQRSDELTQAIIERSAAKDAAIAAASLPVPGLGFTEGAITLNGLPFDQASDAEQLQASVAVAMAMNPTLRVVRVRDGSLLDPESMQILAKMANAADCQVWIETVASGRPGAIVIEDGHIAS